MEWGPAIAALFGVLLWLLKTWASGEAEREQEQHHDAIQQGRTDIADSDVSAVSERIDRLLMESSNTTGQPGGEITAGRISAVSGMADTGRDTGTDT